MDKGHRVVIPTVACSIGWGDVRAAVGESLRPMCPWSTAADGELERSERMHL